MEELYQLSYLWYGILAVSVVVVVGLTVSFVTGKQLFSIAMYLKHITIICVRHFYITLTHFLL